VPAHSQPIPISFHQSLRTKIVLGVALPILLVLSLFSLVHYLRERHLLETQIAGGVQQLGDLVLGSLRHAMAINDPQMLDGILHDLNMIESIRRVQIIGIDHRVKANSSGKDENAALSTADQGCVECHSLPTESRPSTTVLSGVSGIVRAVRPIDNEPECARCHTEQSAHLGVLLVDVSLVDLERHLLDDLRVDLLFSGGATVLVTLGIYVLINQMVLRRIGTFRRPLAEIAQGHFGARVPIPLHPGDEIDGLILGFNHMADEVERHTREQEARSDLRQRAIVEERERIARELHDGLAQLLGYVNTKASAVRLMLKNRQADAAEKHLQQLEEAAQELFVDVREAILGLKMNGHAAQGSGLPTALKAYTAQFSRLSNLPVDVRIDPAAEDLALPAETELQLMRIVQESLTNVRKHASARQAIVSLQFCDSMLELSVRDDGAGFRPGPSRDGDWPRYGLSTMRERAEAIGAAFTLDSDPGAGTRIVVRLKLEKNGNYARSRGG